MKRLAALLLALVMPACVQAASVKVSLTPVPGYTGGFSGAVMGVAAPAVQAFSAPALSAPTLAAMPLLAPSLALSVAAPVSAAVDAPPSASAQLQAASAPQSKPGAVFDGQTPLKLIITGPPGSGKGTYSTRLARDYGVVHISAGDLLREYAKNDPVIAGQMKKGELVPSGLVLRLVQERLAQPDVAARGFVLDGFPRRLEEARALDVMLEGRGVDAVIHLDVPEAELLRRIMQRGRADDTEPVFRDRMKIYREQTLPAVEVFTAKAPVLDPDVRTGDAQSNYGRVRSAVDLLISRLLGR